MNSFTALLATPSAATADPSKHVNYTYGMVLGVDDFTQEFAYLSGRDRWLARDCLGYGTASGLAVSVEPNAETGDTEVVVTAGTAVSPRGQLIKVTPAQCASLNKWLAGASNAQTVKDRLGLPPAGALRLYVVLCYRDCPTDPVPIPGEPCRSEDAATAPSRLQDGFQLELRFDPPDQTEEDALRDFVKWLNEHVTFADDGGPFTGLADFVKTIRQAVVTPSSPPASPPDFLLDSPPNVMHVPAADSCEYLRTAFRLWTTELRPLWRPASVDPCGCGASTTAAQQKVFDDSLLLAELDVPLNADGSLNTGLDVNINEERRPFLLSLRMLQEWLLCGRCCAAAGGGTVLSPPVFSPPVLSPPVASPPALLLDAPHTFATLYLVSPNVVRAWLHFPQVLNVPVAAIQIDASETAAPIAAQPASVTRLAPNLNVFDLQLSAPLKSASRIAVGFDTSQIKEQGSTITLLDALNTHGTTYALDSDGHTLSAYLGVTARALADMSDVSLPNPQANQVLTFQGGKWVAAPLPAAGGTTGPAGGDLAGNYPNPIVARLQGRNVGTTPPSLNQVLTWDGGQWTPANPPSPLPLPQPQISVKPGDPAGGDLGGTYPNPSVFKIQARAVSNAAPNNSDVLTWNDAQKQWQPAALPAPPPPPSQPVINLLPFATIVQATGTQIPTFRCWFNIDAPTNRATVTKLPITAIKVMAETINAPDFLTTQKISAVNPVPNTRNLFDVQLLKFVSLLRFVFDLNLVSVQVGGTNQTALEYMKSSGVNFDGFNGSNLVTVFVPLGTINLG